MDNLVIGNTSQLSFYFPEDYVKISSRNIDFNYICNNNWDNVYITFAEQRLYDDNIDYITPNFFYTLKIIENLLDRANKIVCYTTCELWNLQVGKISKNTKINFDINNQYALSKFILFDKIKKLKKIDSRYQKVIFIHPFYFNSIKRSKYFLFGKIFDSILNKKKINVNNINFYRDVVHTKFVIEQSINAKEDSFVGSGRLTNIRDFIIDLYTMNNLDYRDFLHEESTSIMENQKLIMADVCNDYSYSKLLQDTQEDFLNYV